MRSSAHIAVSEGEPSTGRRDAAGAPRTGAPASKVYRGRTAAHSRLASAAPIRENAALVNWTAPGFPRMQRLLLSIALAAAAVFAYLYWFAEPSPQYRIVDIDRQPIPRAEFFALWRETAYGLCDSGRGGSQALGPADCRRYVSQAHDRCVAGAGAGAPAMVAGKDESRRWARPYLDCVLPAPTCNGVEVRTLEQALRHCPP